MEGPYLLGQDLTGHFFKIWYYKKDFTLLYLKSTTLCNRSFGTLLFFYKVTTLFVVKVFENLHGYTLRYAEGCPGIKKFAKDTHRPPATMASSVPGTQSRSLFTKSLKLPKHKNDEKLFLLIFLCLMRCN